MIKTEQYKEAFGHMLKNNLNTNDHSFLEGAYTSVDGGYVFPFNEKMEETLRKNNLFRDYATILKANAEGTIIATSDNAKAEIVGENQLIPESNNDSKEIKYSAYKIAALSRLKLAFINDRHFDVEDYLATKFAKRFGRCEENLIINGNGETEPLGILNNAIKFTEVKSLDYDALLKIYFSLEKEYRSNAVWIINDETAIALRSMKNSSGLPIWNHNDNTIFGKEVRISNYLTDSAKPILFGDLSYISIIIRKPLNVRVLTEKYFAKGEYGYAGNERIDAKLTDINSIVGLVVKAEE